MKAGYTVETKRCDYWDKVLVVTNYHVLNLIINHPLICYPKKNRVATDVGMWKIKQLKN